MRMNIILLSLLVAYGMVSCGVGEQHYSEVKSVRDQYRMLGMIEAEDGMYEFRLCSAGLTSYSAEAMRNNCINPLVDAEGNLRRFSSIPSAENTSVLKIRNAAFAALMGVGAGAAVYVGTRFVKRGGVAKKIVGEVRLATLNKRLNDAVRMNDYAFAKAGATKGLYDEPTELVAKRIDSNYAKGKRMFSDTEREALVKRFTDTESNSEELSYAAQAWLKRNADILALAKRDDATGDLVANEGLQHFILESAHGFKAADEVYLKQLAVLDEALDGRVYSYMRDGKRYTANKFGEPELFPEEIAVEDHVFMTIRELSEESSESRSAISSELKDRINIQRDKQRRHLKDGVKKVKKSIVGNPTDMKSSRLVDRIKNRFKNIFKTNDKTQAYDVNSVAKEIAGSFEGAKTARVYVPATAQARAGQVTAIASATSFFFVPNLQRMLPGHAALETNKNWSAIVGDFGSSEEVVDLRLILQGLAQATNSHISTQVRIFGL